MWGGVAWAIIDCCVPRLVESGHSLEGNTEAKASARKPGALFYPGVWLPHKQLNGFLSEVPGSI
jgi:hypothetical protein